MAIVTDGVDIFEVVLVYNAWCIQTNKFQHFLTESFEVIGNINENLDLLGEKYDQISYQINDKRRK